MPLPAQLKDDAAVVTTDGAGGQRVIRKGRTALTCSPDGPNPGFSVSCINGSTGNVIQAYTGHLARGATTSEAWEAANAAIEAGTLTTATPGTLIFMLSGPSRAEAGARWRTSRSSRSPPDCRSSLRPTAPSSCAPAPHAHTS